MKRIITITLFLLFIRGAFSQIGRSFYQKYSDEPGVSAVYISPAMFRMMGSIPEITAGDNEVNLAPIIRSLKGMYIINSENVSLNSKLSKEITKALNSGNYELMMEAKEDGEKVQIYTAGSDATVTSFILVSDEGNEFTVIWLDGEMPREQMENLLSDTIEIN